VRVGGERFVRVLMLRSNQLCIVDLVPFGAHARSLQHLACQPRCGRQPGHRRSPRDQRGAAARTSSASASGASERA
jgi:hypothetical protein